MKALIGFAVCVAILVAIAMNAFGHKATGPCAMRGGVTWTSADGSSELCADGWAFTKDQNGFWYSTNH